MTRKAVQTFRACGEVFEFDDYDGSLDDFYAGLDYQLSERVAFGVGVNSVRLDIGARGKTLSGSWTGATMVFFVFKV